MVGVVAEGPREVAFEDHTVDRAVDHAEQEAPVERGADVADFAQFFPEP